MLYTEHRHHLVCEEEQKHFYTDHLLDRKEAAIYLRVKVGTLAVWDCTKRYDLHPIKVGKLVRYRKSVLDKFLEDRLAR